MNDDKLLVMSSISLKRIGSHSTWRDLISPQELEILITVCITHICIGYAMGAISPAMESVTEDFHLNDTWRGVLGSAALAGNMFGSPMGGSIADTYGRRACIITAWTMLILGSLLQSLSAEILMLCVSRAVVGWAVGAHYAAITTYLSETLNPMLIGKLLSFTEFNFFIGNFIAIAVGALLNTYVASEAVQWRTTLLLSGIPSIFTLTYFAYSMPESQQWLDSQKPEESPTTQARRYETIGENSPQGADIEVAGNALTTQVTYMSLRKSIVFVSAFWGSLVVPTYAVSAFAVAIISELGLSVNAFTLNTFLAAAVATGVALGIPLVDICGRKRLLLISQWGVAVAFAVMAAVQPFAEATRLLKWTLIVAFVAFEVLNGAGAPLALVYPAEIFPPAVKGLASGVSAMNSRIMAISVILTMSAMLSHLGVAWTLFSLSALSSLGAIVTHIMAPKPRVN